MKVNFSLDSEFRAQLFSCLFAGAVGFLLSLIIELFKAII